MRTARHLLAIVPPYRHRNCPPAGAAALLGHLKQLGHDELRFVDLRLLVPDVFLPTYDPVGVFGESYVIDVPDLPLVLRLLSMFDDGHARLVPDRDAIFDRYCRDRGLDAPTLHAYLAGMDTFLGEALASFPDLRFVGFSTWSSNFLTTLMATAHLKRRAHPPFVVAGGPQVTESRCAARLGLRAGLFDVVVLGEGEETLAEIWEGFTEGRSPAVAGALTRGADGEPVEGAARPLRRLSSSSLPDFTEMSLPTYRAADGSLRLPFRLSRGCTHKCAFCTEWVFWRHFRPDSVEHACDQLERLVRTYGVRTFHFTDSLLNGHMGRLRDFAETLVRRGPRVTWGGFMRADMDVDTAKLLHTAGCTYAFVGVESFADETLALMNKRRTATDNLRAIDALLRSGMRVTVGVIPGFPGDTRHRFMRTVEVLEDFTRGYGEAFSFNVEPFIVSPSQPIYANLERFGLTAAAWPAEVLDLAPRYRDITAGIACQVAGSNQGVERLGQLQLLQSMVARRCVRAADPVYDHGEDPDDRRVIFVSLSTNRFVLRAKARGRVVGAIVTRRERERCQALAERAPLGTKPLDWAPVRDFFDRLAARNAWRPGTRLYPSRQVRDVRHAAALVVPPHVVGRRMTARSGDVLVVASLVTGAAVEVRPPVDALLAWLAAVPRTRADVERRLGGACLSRSAWARIASALLRRGLLEATEMEAPPRRFHPAQRR